MPFASDAEKLNESAAIWTPNTGVSMPEANTHDETGIVFDRELALSALGNDLELMSELAALFLSDLKSMLEKIHAAARAGDGPSLGRAAHQLKGAASNFRAQLTVEAAEQLEHMGRGNDLGGVSEALATLLGELDRLEPELEKLIQS